METPERLVCCTLCLCMAVAVFSSVALVYLTALVYMPSKREIQSGLSDIPVVCTTIQMMETDECDWYSCGEWCLSKSSHCVKLWAQVRKNGSDVVISGCRDVQDITCMVLDDDFVPLTACQHDADCSSLNDRFFDKCGPYDCGLTTRPFACDAKARRCVSVRQYRNCKNDDTCTNLNSFHMCENGLCQNITSVFDCSYEKALPPVDCRDKRNCITLTGMFHCRHGQCSQIEWPWHCERRCALVNTSPTRNVILLSGDRMLSASCSSATRRSLLNAQDRLTIWEDRQRDRDTILMASCTSVDLLKGGLINASDCVNGTLMPRELLPPKAANYTVIHDLFQRHGIQFPMDERWGRPAARSHYGEDSEDMEENLRLTRMEKIPFDTDINIYNRTKLLINTEACVNTLKYECTQFYLDHRRDGRNYSARDRFPCYYTPTHGDYVTTRFSIAQTQYIFLLAFAIPATLWVISCSCLFGCSKMLRVEEATGQMRVRCRQRKRRTSAEEAEEATRILLGGAEAMAMRRKERRRSRRRTKSKKARIASC